MHTLLKTCDENRCAQHRDLCSHVCLDCKNYVCTTCLFEQCCEHETLEIGEAARRYVEERLKRAALMPDFYQSHMNSPILNIENPDTGCLESVYLTILPILVDGKSRTKPPVINKSPVPAQGATGSAADTQLKKPVPSDTQLKKPVPSGTQLKKPEAAASQVPIIVHSGYIAVSHIQPVSPSRPAHTSFQPPPVPAGPRSVCVNPGAYINMHAVLHGKPPFRFSRVVLDNRPCRLAVVARYRYMILRYNINHPASESAPETVEIFIDGLTSGFDEQEDILCGNTMLFHQRGWRRYLPQIKELVRDYHIYRRWVLVENYSDVSHETKDIAPMALPFQLDKVVHDERYVSKVIVARCGDHIIRCDYNSNQDTSKDRINIYNRQSRSYEDQEDMLDEHPDFFNGDLPEWESNILELRAMIKKYKEFLANPNPVPPSPPRRQNNQIKFEKIVHDRRRGNNALVAKYRDVIIRNDYTDESDCVDIIHPCQVSTFDDQQNLLDRFIDILNTNWQGTYLEEVRAMVREFRDHMRTCDDHCSCAHY